MFLVFVSSNVLIIFRAQGQCFVKCMPVFPDECVIFF